MIINKTCKLSTYLYLLRSKRIKNWSKYYGFIFHNLWSIFQMSLMFIYGLVWVNRFDVAYAIGVLTRLIFDVSFSDACPPGSGTPIANSPDFDPNEFN